MATAFKSIIIDSNSNAFHFIGEWELYMKSLGGLLGKYGGTAGIALGLSSFDFSFEGTSAAFVGTFPVTATSQLMTMRIDKGTPFNVSDTGTGDIYKQWYQTPTLSDGRHTISVNCPAWTIIDFAIVNVTIGNQTSFPGDIIVDNDSPSIAYSGHWTRSTGLVQNSTAYPYGNSTHRSSTAGDSFTFRFTGTSVSVSGISPRSDPGLAATYTIDGVTVPKTHNATSALFSANFVFYSKDNLSAGDHTLIVNITVANNLTFELDFITYTPSFKKLSSNNSTPTIKSVSESPSPSQVPTSALVILVAVVGSWLFLRRRKSRQTGFDYQNDADRTQQYMPQPRYPIRQPAKLRKSNPAEQATCSGSNRPPSSDPHNVDNLVAALSPAAPPPYAALTQ